MGKLIKWDEKVSRDYRERIIVDPDHPILAFKANRDRYTLPNQPLYKGLSYLGSQNSEDALTWNVFRSLQMAGNLNILTDQLKIGQPRGLLLWTLAPDITGDNAGLQYAAGALIRECDGILRGQISEPDVIILGTTGIAVIECKLSEPDKAPPHLWEGVVDRVGMRLPIYNEKNPGLLRSGIGNKEVAPVYQLVRVAFYAVELGKYYGLEPIVLSLANSRNWFLKAGKRRDSAADLWDVFSQILGGSRPHCQNIFWQDLSKWIAEISMETLSDYLSSHTCL